MSVRNYIPFLIQLLYFRTRHQPKFMWKHSQTTVRELLPTREFAPTMIRIGQEFYGVNSSLLFFAGTTRYAEQNVRFF